MTGSIGAADAGLTVTIYEGATALGTATVNPDGSWTATVTLSGEGAHSLTAKATDGAGNTGTSAAVSYTLDTLAPSIAITSMGGLTNNATQTVAGTGEAGASVALMDGMTQIGTATVAGDGSWSIDVTLSEGAHSLMAHATDAAGNMGMSGSVGYTIDTTAPTVSLVTIPPETTTATTATFSWTSSDADVASYRYSTDGGANWTSTTDTSVTLTGLAVGAHSFQVEAIDGAGNSSAIASDTWTIEPSIVVTVAPFSGDNYVNKTERLAEVTLTGSYSGFSGGGTVSYVIVDSSNVTKGTGSTSVSGAAGNYSILVPLNTVKNLLDGTYTLTVTGTDSTSQTGTASETFMVDRLGPTVTLTSQPPELTNQTTATFTWSAADGSGSGAATYQYSTNGGSTWTTTSDTSVTLTGLAAGNRSFKVRAVDFAGNVGAAVTDTWKIDLTPPAKPVITGTAPGLPASNPAWIVSGTAEKGSTVTIYRLVNGVPTAVGTGVANASTGAFSVQTIANEHGLRILYAVATDAAGNASAPSLLYYQGGHHADLITLTSPADLVNISKVDGYEDSDTLKFSSPTTVVDSNFTKVSSVENIELTGVSAVTLGTKAAAAGVTNVITGNGNTLVQETVIGSSLSVDASAMAGATLSLSGWAHFTVNDLNGNLNAGAVGLTGSVNATVLGGGHNVEGGLGWDTFTATEGANTFTGRVGGDTFNVSGHTGSDVFVYNSLLDSANALSAWDQINGFNTATDCFNFANLGVDSIQGGLSNTSTKVGAHDVAWIYDASANETRVYANTTGSLLSQNSALLLRVDLAGDLSASLGAGNFQFAAA